MNSKSNTIPVIKYANRAYLFDNSGKQQVLIAEIAEGFLQIKSDNIPNWFIDYVIPYYQH